MAHSSGKGLFACRQSQEREPDGHARTSAPWDAHTARGRACRVPAPAATLAATGQPRGEPAAKRGVQKCKRPGARSELCWGTTTSALQQLRARLHDARGHDQAPHLPIRQLPVRPVDAQLPPVFKLQRRLPGPLWAMQHCRVSSVNRCFPDMYWYMPVPGAPPESAASGAAE